MQKTRQSPLRITLALKFFKALCGIYPESFRREYEDQLLATISDSLRQEDKKRGLRGILSELVSASLDVTSAAFIERAESITRSRREFMKVYVLAFLAICFGFVSGWIDIHNDEVQATVASLLLFGFILGVSYPKLAWLWALMLGVSIPISGTIAISFGIKFAYEPTTYRNVLQSFIAVIPAFIGAYVGVGVRSLFRALLKA